MEKFLKNSILKEQMKSLNGGRREVVYIDSDNDGRWDIKIINVYRRGNLVKRIIRER